MDHRKRLGELLVERSLRLGDFTLASGARSSYYIDARRTTMSAEGQSLVGRVCLSLLQESGWKASHAGGLTMGADPVAYAIAHRSWLEGTPVNAFSVRKKPKAHGTGQQVEGGLPKGVRCVVVEDAMTTGGSALEAIRVLEEYGVEIAGVLTLVDREEGGRDRLEEAGHGLLAAYSGPDLLELARSSGG